ncbi:VOC family protein [Paramicrobacterium agarici]|uniref:Putative glyoxalase superfamily protein PhnB n=1 Tax=Paramicrobacterium agarici TaxID=630514 RepID=A0A2A9DT50_9MICO|nr:VOC family protein [Microbacterium agarici]PFG29541.1 putative glyoxalase superfamily protein PhnB [Microbacterium agarici]TQO22545.1 putative glyoxalase superfamily protein PhnB [Microbacterium agarici]
MFRGIANVNVVSTDVPAAITWYSGIFGEAPYFKRPETGEPQYAEWRFGDDEDEFAVMDAAFRPVTSKPGGTLVYLHVDDVRASFDELIAAGAREFDPVMQRSEEWWTASVVDPFGNLIGLIQSPHWAAAH